MNIVLWVFQILLALHTAMGAVWKFSKTAEETMPSLKAIPSTVWLGMSVVELICCVLLVLPFLYKPAAPLFPFAAIFIVVEMLAFCGLHLQSGDANYGPMIYWLVVAAICSFIAYGRMVLSPL